MSQEMSEKQVKSSNVPLFCCLFTLGLLIITGWNLYQTSLENHRLKIQNTSNEQRIALLQDQLIDVEYTSSQAGNYQDGYRDALIKMNNGTYKDGFEAAQIVFKSGSYEDGYHNAIQQLSEQQQLQMPVSQKNE